MDRNALCNTNISNQYSAVQHPQAIRAYIDKESSHGTILGPVDSIHSTTFHCSPLLTRPKDGSKRRVILNLSYPKGNSVNDQVDKRMFDNRPFTLRFPSVDDIVMDILNCDDDPVIFKVDIARAFRNLRADPRDAVKFGLTWEDKYTISIQG